MPWSDLAELMGASAIVMAVLVVFWKGDDCISTEFRDDLAAWLILLKPPPGNSPVAQAVLAVFERVFGERHFSWRCLGVSFTLSTLFFALIVGLYFYFSNMRDVLLEYFPQSSFGAAFTILFLGMLLNGLGDYPSLYVTRRILRLSRKRSVPVLFAVILDFVFSVLIVCLFLSLVTMLFTQTGSGSGDLRRAFDIVAEVLFADLSGNDGIFEGSIEVVQLVLRVAVFTAFITSMWLWAAALGTYAIRLLARSGPILSALQYALPIEEKPVRSMGIVGFLIFFIYLLISTAIRSVA